MTVFTVQAVVIMPIAYATAMLMFLSCELVKLKLKLTLKFNGSIFNSKLAALQTRTEEYHAH